MKISLKCKSPLLNASLERFLAPFVVSDKTCEFYITDFACKSKKPVYIIGGKNIQKPFTKDELLISLENFYHTSVKSDKVIDRLSVKVKVKDSKNDALEKKIDSLTKEFSQNLVSLIKAHYEK